MGAENKLAEIKAAKGKGHTSKPKNQSAATSMNAAVAADVKEQEEEAAAAAAAEASASEDGNTADASSANSDAMENYADTVAEEQEGTDVVQSKEDFDAAVEARAQEIADERAEAKAAVPRSVAATPLDVNDHSNICTRMTASIEGIKKVVPHLMPGHDGLGVLLGMLSKIGKVTAKLGKTLPTLSAPDKAPSFAGVKFGEDVTPKACGIYRRELIGHCANLVECADHLPKKACGAWVGYLNALKKVLEKADA